MQTEFQERDISIATRNHIFLDTKSVCRCYTLNTAEYQGPQSHGLVCIHKRGEHLLEMYVSIRAYSSLVNCSSLSYARRTQTEKLVVILRCSND